MLSNKTGNIKIWFKRRMLNHYTFSSEAPFRLPHVNSESSEFKRPRPFSYMRSSVAVSRRIFGLSLQSILRPTPIILLTSCSSLVMGLGMYEGSLYLLPEVEVAEAFEFAFYYGWQNFLPSWIWSSSPPDLTALYLDMIPENVLRSFHPTPSDASVQLNIKGLQTKRSIVAGFMLITQVLGLMNVSLRAAESYARKVLSGAERPLKGTQERIIRLAGQGSDATEVSMARFPQHFLPIYEDPSTIRHLVRKWSAEGHIPVIWGVKDGHYGFRHSWAGLEIDSSFMLKTTTGRSVLCIEADATNADEALEFGQPSDDLSVEDASQAYRLIHRMAAKRIRKPFRLIRVFLGDSLQECVAGGAEPQTLRERILLKKEADVLIDSKAPLLIEILKWCRRVTDQDKLIALDASPVHYLSLREILQHSGYVVVDHKAVTDQETLREEVGGMEVVNNLPRLIYHPTTAATVNAVYALTDAGQADPAKCCVLINSPFGIEHLTELFEETGHRFEAICAGEIHDTYFQKVRVWVRMGYSGDQIQKELDLLFNEALNIQKLLKEQKSF